MKKLSLFLFLLSFGLSNAQDRIAFRDGRTLPADEIIQPCTQTLDSNLIGLIDPDKYCRCLYGNLGTLYSYDTLLIVSEDSSRLNPDAISNWLYSQPELRSIGQYCLSNSALQAGFGLDLTKAISYLASNIRFELKKDPNYAYFIKIYDPDVYANCMAAELISQVGLQALFGSEPSEEIAQKIGETCLKAALRQK